MTGRIPRIALELADLEPWVNTTHGSGDGIVRSKGLSWD
jgi:hypothetical protein